MTNKTKNLRNNMLAKGGFQIRPTDETLAEIQKLMDIDVTTWDLLPEGDYYCKITGHLPITKKDENGDVKAEYNLINTEVLEGTEKGKKIGFFGSDTAGDTLVDIMLATRADYTDFQQCIGAEVWLTVTHVIAKDGTKRCRATLFNRPVAEKEYNFTFNSIRLITNYVNGSYSPLTKTKELVSKICMIFVDEAGEIFVMKANQFQKDKETGLFKTHKDGTNPYADSLLTSLATALCIPSKSYSGLIDRLNTINDKYEGKVSLIRNYKTKTDGTQWLDATFSSGVPDTISMEETIQ